jgi:hypothetical protein
MSDGAQKTGTVYTREFLCCQLTSVSCASVVSRLAWGTAKPTGYPCAPPPQPPPPPKSVSAFPHTWFGFVIRFIEHSLQATASNCDSVYQLQSPKVSVATALYKIFSLH